MRRIWSTEISAHESLRSRMLEESIAWKKEKIARDAERAHWEKEREGIAWEGFVRSNKCLRYGTREYTSILTHVPLGSNAMAECSKKPASINGKELLPTRCEDPGSCGNAIGHWEVEGDVMCSPVWGRIYDKGCNGNTYGKRRFESQLMNLHPGDDWHVLCPTTPVEIRGRNISAPDTCADWGLRGIWGIWFVPDDQCR
ncbi:hypothetical protein CPC08DRAFT_111711 [Agrocybe pediades]|nr:hypothetical protein CPC08DRAFT_111711 [Agrocybe pediades]